MKKMTRTLGLLLVLSMVLTLLCACGKPTITSIEVTTLPNKTEYRIGEAFSVDGGKLTVHLSDNSKEEIALTAEGVSIDAPNMDKAGNKSITVNYGGMRARMSVTVEPIQLTFEMNGVGTAPAALKLSEVGPVDAADLPADPTAEGYEFNGWFTNEGLSETFDPTAVIEENTVLYASWRSLDAVSYEVVFDKNFTGASEAQVLTVEDGNTVSAPADEERSGYQFEGWFTEAEAGEAYDFSAPVTGDMTLYAHWFLVASGVNQYLFEAEDVSLSGKAGKGYSGEAEGKGLVQREAAGSTLGVSNDRFVGYTYVNGFTLDFYIVSDREVEDATITARLSGEFADFTLTPEMFVISLNGEEIRYGKIEIKDVPDMAIREFQDFVILENAHLVEGSNCLEFRVNNDVNWIGGGTIAATAPLVDCVKIDTSAVLGWDGAHNLPAKNYTVRK